MARRTDVQPMDNTEAPTPRRWRTLPPDGRSRGSMAQFVREFLTDNPQGWSRLDLRIIVRGKPEFAATLSGNPNAFYNLIGRMRRGGEIEDQGGLLFASAAVKRRVSRVRSHRSPHDEQELVSLDARTEDQRD